MKSKNLAAPRDDWEVEDDIRTLMRAREIQRDPKRMAAVQKMARQKIEDMKNLASK